MDEHSHPDRADCLWERDAWEPLLDYVTVKGAKMRIKRINHGKWECGQCKDAFENATEELLTELEELFTEHEKKWRVCVELLEGRDPVLTLFRFAGDATEPCIAAARLTTPISAMSPRPLWAKRAAPLLSSAPHQQRYTASKRDSSGLSSNRRSINPAPQLSSAAKGAPTNGGESRNTASRATPRMPSWRKKLHLSFASN